MNMNKILSNLNNLRFGELIIYSNPDAQYDNSGYDNSGYYKKEIENKDKAEIKELYGRKTEVKTVCDICKSDEQISDIKINNTGELKYKDYRLKIVSHGCHSLDLFNKQGLENTAYSNYRDDGVMLIMESPSSNLSACYEKPIKDKYPAKVWWWLEANDTDKPTEYPNEFVSRKYGQFFNSLVHTFKLKNAYMTNFIKCGLLDSSNENFGQFEAFSDSCKKIALINFYSKKLKLYNPKFYLYSARMCTII